MDTTEGVQLCELSGIEPSHKVENLRVDMVHVCPCRLRNDARVVVLAELGERLGDVVAVVLTGSVSVDGNLVPSDEQSVPDCSQTGPNRFQIRSQADILSRCDVASEMFPNRQKAG